ncbi:MAG: glycosyltransferase [Alphaproteobacteria bacterium]|nr:glycosyltransferase [Alphaproteobacteria bacterium]
MPQTICYVLSAFPVLSETFVTNEIRAMRALGHRIVPVALAPFDGPCQPQDEAMKGDVIHLAEIPTLAALAVRPDRLAAAWQFIRTQRTFPSRALLRAGARVALAARKAGATHIHAHFAHSAAATAITAARLSGLTVSFIGHGYDIYGSPVDLAAKLRAADLVFATCEDMAADFRALEPAANVTVTSGGVDPANFAPRGGRRNGRLLAIGRLTEQKGYPVLFQALARLPSARRAVVDIVGTGPLEAELAALAEGLGVAGSVRFLGARSSAWIAANGPDYLGLVAPFVICANGDRDTGPIVVKEAMAMGLPVVASALMGMKEMVAPECGRQVPPGDAAALATAIDWLTTLDEPTRTAIGAAGRRHVEANYTLAGQAQAMTAAITSLQERRTCAA